MICNGWLCFGSGGRSWRFFVVCRRGLMAGFAGRCSGLVDCHSGTGHGYSGLVRRWLWICRVWQRRLDCLAVRRLRAVRRRNTRHRPARSGGRIVVCPRLLPASLRVAGCHCRPESRLLPQQVCADYQRLSGRYNRQWCVRVCSVVLRRCQPWQSVFGCWR